MLNPVEYRLYIQCDAEVTWH